MKINRTSIRKWRRRQGFSQREFAALLKVSVEAVSSWEQGRRKPQGLYRAALEAQMNQ